MMIEDEYIRLIFGLKLKQIRTEKNLSLFGLAKLSGLSKSYLNEIEKGKKYPKTDKILLLSENLEVPYDHFVSLKLDKNLAPIGEILQSKILKEIPLELFGIKENNLIDIIANAPAKVNAFISTIIKIAQNYNLTRESFFLASLRSYQEAHNNYFEDIENDVEKFAKLYHINLSKRINSKDLEEILIEEFGYKIDDKELSKHDNLGVLRNIYIPKKKILLIDKNISEAQKTFIYAKELAYNHLKIKDRLYTFPWIKFENFDKLQVEIEDFFRELKLSDACQNAAIDATKEQRILKQLKVESQGKSSIIISHRISTLKDAEKIIVLNNGEIIESGSHTELLSQRGFYFEMHQIQANKES